MSREIKFRGHVKATGKVLNVKYIDFSKSPKTNSIVALVGDRVVCRKLIDVDIIEYTGLKDKKGKEIYEGDVVRTITEPDCGCPPKKANLIIKFDPYDATFCAAEPEHYFGLKVSWGGFVHLEVIGNIYENPELIKEPIDA